jgi:hypothetical protein
MERKMNQLYVDVEILFQLFNTHGTEITPRSDVVGKNLKRNGIGHGHCSCKFRRRVARSNNATRALSSQLVPAAFIVNAVQPATAKFSQIQH